MGDNNVGGNGSVEWSVDVNDPKWVVSSPKTPKGHRQGGADEGGQPGEQFEITIEVPVAAADKAVFVKSLGDALSDVTNNKQKVKLLLPIEQQNPDQIQIHWPNK
jgi:hypothetical protein